MQCIILAGGLATRMKPITETIQKSLIPVNDVPFVHYQLTLLKDQGVESVIFCIGHLGEQLRSYVGDGSRWGLRVSYVDEGKELRGTAGALRLAYESGEVSERFFVLYGDSYLPIDFRGVWKHFTQTNAVALMTVFLNQNRWDSSNVAYESGRVACYDKFRRHNIVKNYIDYGLSAFDSRIISERIPAGKKMDLAEIFENLSMEGKLAGFEVTERFYEIGSPTGLEDFTSYIKATEGSILPPKALPSHILAKNSPLE